MRPMALCVLAATLLWLGAATAGAFDTGPHADLTRDALTAEGFSAAAGDVGMVDNWFVDYYTNPGKNPYSGHASCADRRSRGSGSPRENWPSSGSTGARQMHFDSERRGTSSMPNLSTDRRHRPGVAAAHVPAPGSGRGTPGADRRPAAS